VAYNDTHDYVITVVLKLMWISYAYRRAQSLNDPPKMDQTDSVPSQVSTSFSSDKRQWNVCYVCCRWWW